MTTLTYNPTVLLDCYVSINGQVISEHAAKAEIPYSADAKESTTFGAGGHTYRGGLKGGSLNLSLFNDYTDNNLDEIMWALIGEVVTFEVRPTSDAVSTSNPSYTGNIFVNGWTPIAGSVGDLVTQDVSYQVSGLVDRNVS